MEKCDFLSPKIVARCVGPGLEPCTIHKGGQILKLVFAICVVQALKTLFANETLKLLGTRN